MQTISIPTPSAFHLSQSSLRRREGTFWSKLLTVGILLCLEASLLVLIHMPVVNGLWKCPKSLWSDVSCEAVDLSCHTDVIRRAVWSSKCWLGMCPGFKSRRVHWMRGDGVTAISANRAQVGDAISGTFPVGESLNPINAIMTRLRSPNFLRSV